MNTAHTLYYLLEQQKYNEIELIINNINMYKINNSILTCIISYYVKTNNKMLDIIKKDINMLDLHKRDYMMLCKYYYNIDNNYAINIFKKYIVDNKTITLLTKDMDYLVSNNLVILIELLVGRYIKTSVDISNYHVIRNINPQTNMQINMNLHGFEKNINKNELDKFYTHINSIDYEYVVDGCNILFYNGHINKQNINNLFKIINNKNTLVIIHTRHLKKYPDIKKQLELKGCKYYFTPHNHNDDLFILLAFIKALAFTKTKIISNDKYREHILNFTTNQYEYMQFKNILYNHTINFDYNTLYNNYNHSIEIINNKLLIPHIMGDFIELGME